MLLPRGSNFLQMKVGYTYKNIPIISKNKNSVINKQELKEIVTRNGRDRGGRSGPVRWLFGWGSQPRRAKDARDRVCRHHHRLRPPASLSGPVPSPTPTIPPLLSGPSNPIPPNPLLLLVVPLPRPRLDPEGISGRPPSLQFRAQLPRSVRSSCRTQIRFLCSFPPPRFTDSRPFRLCLSAWGHFGIVLPRGVCLGPKDPIRLDFCPRAGARPEAHDLRPARRELMPPGDGSPSLQE